MTDPDTQAVDHRKADSSQDSLNNSRRGRAKSTTMGGAAVALLVAFYAVAQPVLNDRFGWQLPGVQEAAPSGGSVGTEKGERKSSGVPQTPSDERAKESPAVSSTPTAEASKPKISSGPLAKVRSKETAKPNDPARSASPSVKSPTSNASTENATSRETPKPNSNPSLLHGILADQGNDRFMSPAGLMYGPGSQEGHRLKHLERHTVDDPDRPGSHGVFDGGMPGALALIDKAYQKAKTGVQTSKQEEDGRVIYTVDMGSRVGYVGGIDGRRRKNPMARRIRLVLERNRVITAYPM